MIRCKRYEVDGPENIPNPSYVLIKMSFHMSDVASCEETMDEDRPGTDVFFYNGWCRTITISYDTFSKWFDEFHAKPKFLFTSN